MNLDEIINRPITNCPTSAPMSKDLASAIGELSEKLRRLGPPPRAQPVIVTHPDNMPALEKLLTKALRDAGLVARDSAEARLWRSFGIGSIDVAANEYLDRWVTRWQPPDWGPCWQLGPEDEATLRPLGFGRFGPVVGEPAFWRIDRGAFQSVHQLFAKPELEIAHRCKLFGSLFR